MVGNRKVYKEVQLRTALPENGFLRLNDVLTFFPVSRSTWWGMIKKGEAPKPVKLSRRCSAWRVQDIRALIADRGEIICG